jgi:hypothetical protein
MMRFAIISHQSEINRYIPATDIATLRHLRELDILISSISSNLRVD